MHARMHIMHVCSLFRRQFITTVAVTSSYISPLKMAYQAFTSRSRADTHLAFHPSESRCKLTLGSRP